MPAAKRIKTKYAGVTYIEAKSPTGAIERVYYIRYRRDGKLIEEKAGRQFQDDMTPAKASGIRARRLEGKEESNTERREQAQAEKQAEADRWTVGRLWEEYKAAKHDYRGVKSDEGRFRLYLAPAFANKEPHTIHPFEVDRLRMRLLKKVSPQTARHALALLQRIVKYGERKGVCKGMSFVVELPRLNNKKTEDLNPDELARLLKTMDEDTCIQAANIMKTALFTGMRRGEMFKLKWSDVDFGRGFIELRDPKGGVDQKIPLNGPTRDLLASHPRTGSEYVFPGRGGNMRTDVRKQVDRIKRRAGLPKSFRPLHGLRHVYASMLASSGQVDMYTLQKLMTHKSPQMTQRYAHLRDDAMKRAADVAGDIFGQLSANGQDAAKNGKVVNLREGKG